MRTFVALEIPDNVRSQMYSIGEKIPGRMALVPKDNIHITLQFLGDIGEAQVLAAARALDSVSQSSFPVLLRGLSYFGGRNMHTIFAKVFDNARTSLLYNAVGKALSDCGIGYAAQRDYTPHATIARVKAQAPDTREFISQNAEHAFGEFIAQSICLKKSVLSSSGALYATLHERELS